MTGTPQNPPRFRKMPPRLAQGLEELPEVRVLESHRGPTSKQGERERGREKGGKRKSERIRQAEAERGEQKRTTTFETGPSVGRAGSTAPRMRCSGRG